jgi:asparagine synthase (glutamine-hydrolysing)
MLYVDTKLWLPDYLLARGDKLSMAVSLEGRVPLLDYKLVEFAASLPPHLKMNQLTRKYLLKKVSQKYLPPEIIRRKKQGFPAPVPMWLRTEARAFVHDLLSSHTIHKRGLFKPDYVAKLLNEHDSGFADHATLLYGLINLELWQQMFMDAPLAVPG